MLILGNIKIYQFCVAISITFTYNYTGVYMKNATVSVRVEHDIKQAAESVLEKLGVPVSVVINSLYRQIIYKSGIPFSLSIPRDVKTLDSISEAEFDAMLMEGYRESLEGKGMSVEEAFKEIERDFQ